VRKHTWLSSTKYHPEDGGWMDFRNISILPQHYAASQPARNRVTSRLQVVRLSQMWRFKSRSPGLWRRVVVVGYQRFRCLCCLHFTLKMEAYDFTMSCSRFLLGKYSLQIFDGTQMLSWSSFLNFHRWAPPLLIVYILCDSLRRW